MRRIPFSILVCAALAGSVFAEPLAPTEYEIKAAFLYNFAKFVEWPADAFRKEPGALVIGILGNDPFGHDLDDALEGKTIQDKKIVLKRVSDWEQASECNVLFVSASQEHDVEGLLNVIKKLPILTVSDMGGFAQRGGVVGMMVEGNKVRFNVNTKAANAAGLKVSSQLLKLAKRVISRRLEKILYVCLPFATIPSAGS